MRAIKLLRVMATLVAIMVVNYSFARDVVTFHPDQHTKAALHIDGNRLLYDVTTADGHVSGSIDTQTEKLVHIQIGDYEFNGGKGFSFWSIDEGMGVYRIYRIFTLSKKTGDFVERLPDCGDGFVNLRVDRLRKRLLSTYFVDNEAKTCVTRLLPQ